MGEMSTIGGLYVIIDPSACRGRDPVMIAREALAGGASMIQWRDKTRDKGLQLPDARAIYDLCLENDAIFIVNDHADLALVLSSGFRPQSPQSSAQSQLLGLHVGQGDLPVADVRRIVPAGFVVGASTNNVDEARKAEADGASYIAVGDIFGTASKEGTRSASPERLAEVRRAVSKPVIGIGGINAGNLHQVMAAGADGISVISAVCAADDPRAAAAELAGLIEKYRSSTDKSG
jgi:thiamine monophosphate synthase